MPVIHSRVFFLRSADRSSGTNNRPTWVLPVSMSLHNNQHHYTMSVPYCEIPFSFHSMSSPDNVFTIQESGHNSQTFEIPEGNYTAPSILTKLKSIIPGGLLMEAFYNKTTGRSSMKFNKNVTLTVSDTLAAHLGYDYNTIVFATHVLTESPNSAYVTRASSIAIRSSTNFSDMARTESLDGTLKTSSIIGYVPVEVPRNYWIVRSQPDQFAPARLISMTITDITVFLTTVSSTREFDLRGIPWTVVVRIDEVQPDEIARALMFDDLRVLLSSSKVAMAKDKERVLTDQINRDLSKIARVNGVDRDV